MITVLRFFSSNAIIIYLILGIGFIFSIRSMARARRENSEAVHGLERELAQRHMTQAKVSLTLVGVLVIAEMALAIILIPNLPAISLFSTKTLNPLTIPTGTLPPGLLITLEAQTAQATATAQTTGCIPGQIAITSPKPGEIIKGQITITGSANIPDFGFFKYEFAPTGSDTWSTVLAGDKLTQDGDLGKWNTSEITPGNYQLRLVVSDNQARELPACIVPVQIAAP